MTYVDGYIVPVPKKKLAAYRRMAKKVGAIWMEHGALSYVECVAVDVKKGKWTSFPRSVKLKPNETVILAWATFKSRKARDAVMAKSMTDKRSIRIMNSKTMPFDGKRMIFGGFKTMMEFTA
jgi:uncharacterized protein YbaA (DUF1428 family)